MSSIDPSMRPMLDMFIYETTTILEQLDEIMLRAEKSKLLEVDDINEIFRFMHTIKGSSAMMGVDSITKLAHAVEDVFYILREEPEKMSKITEAIFDILFQASDYFKVEVESIQNDDYVAQDPDMIVDQLKAQVKIMNGTAPAYAADAAAVVEAEADTVEPPTETALFQEDSETDAELYQVRVFFTDDCQMENIRSFMLLTQLKDWCEFIDSVPQNPENDSNLCSQIVSDGLLIKFKPSSKPQDIYSVIDASINVKSYDIIESAEEQPKAVAVEVESIADTVFSPAAKSADVPDAVNTNTKATHQLISVNQSKLDQLMDLVGELVTTESMVAGSPDLKGLTLDAFNKSTRELRKLTGELQDIVMSMRMMPLSGVYQKMNRIVRDMSKKLQRKVDLVTLGGDTEMDKTVNDVITDPFIHMIRNSMDHAIEQPEERVKVGKSETGTITIDAKNIGGEIVIAIKDDGRGLNKDQIIAKAKKNGILTRPETEYTEKEIFNLIMLPGFSTKEVVTEFSGRGVGMDVVRKNIEKIGGTISVESVWGAGTTFTIKIPLTLVIVEGMEISVGDTIFTLPITSIKQTFKLFDANQIIRNTDRSEMIMLRGECHPIIRLHELYNIPTKVTDLTQGILIQIENGDDVACLFVDELLGEQQVVVKPFPTYFNGYDIKQSGLSGCTILGDGTISLMLDAGSVVSCKIANAG